MNNEVKSESCFLAFVHIEKAAGTTFIHILRRSYFLRYLDVRPLSKASNGLFCARDLSQSLCINPFIRAFGGHAVTPCSDLLEYFPGIQFVTILRDPIKRYLSQYRYELAVLGRVKAFNEFLEDKGTHNYQTVKIAGHPDLELAKKTLASNFLAVGVVEKLNEFLMLLSIHLESGQFHPAYEIKNIGPKVDRIDPLLDEYKEKILAVNDLDMQLYDYVVKQLMPAQRESYGKSFYQDLELFVSEQQLKLGDRVKYYVDGFFRKAYYEPITGAIRKLHGLTMKGSY